MNPTHLIILNRAPASADGWIHIVPKGELPNREAGIVQVLDDAALDSILAGIAADQQRLGNKWPGIYAGREHFIYNDEQDSAALAWFKTFEKRADGIWASADGLTPAGRDVIANSEYKFTSFVADRRDTQKLDGNKVRILKIDTVGFTNQANGKELLTPITNRGDKILNGEGMGHPFRGNQYTDGELDAMGSEARTASSDADEATRKAMESGRSEDYQAAQAAHTKAARANMKAHAAMRERKTDPYAGAGEGHRRAVFDHERTAGALERTLARLKNRDFPAAGASGASPKTNNERTNTMKSIAATLGLAPEASEDAILGEVTKLQNRATTAESEVSPLKNRITTLETENQTLLGEQIEADFAAAGIKDEKIVNRHKGLLSDPKHFKNRAERTAFIADLAKPAKTGNQRIINRGEGKDATDATNGDEQAKADKIRNRCNELTAGGMKFERAWHQASQEVSATK